MGTNLFTNLVTLTKKHSPALLVGTGLISGGIAIYTAYKAAPKINLLLDEKAKDKGEELTKGEEVKTVLSGLWPTLVASALSALCIIGGYYISGKRCAGLGMALMASEKTLIDYQAKVLEKVGEEKHREIKREIASAKEECHVRPSNPSDYAREEIFKYIGSADGKDLCFDCQSGRYFYSSKVDIQTAVNKVNEELMEGSFVPLNAFFRELGLSEIDLGDNMGWDYNFDGLMKVDIFSKLNEHGRPCIVIDYDTIPHYYRSER